MAKPEEFQMIRFGPYEVTGPQGQILTRHRPLAVSPKAVAVLWTLVQRAGHVVSKEELFTAVWPETVVSEGVLTSRIRELRQALGDTTAKPRYIETVSRRGYRFIGTVVSSQQSAVRREKEEKQKAKGEHRTPSTQHRAPTVVGRETELTQLHRLFVKAASGERQVLFVTGEAGIGKTALVEAFLEGVRNGESGSGSCPPHLPHPKSQSPGPGAWVAVGQCIEHYGAGEAYLPVLAAMSGLCRQADGAQVLSVLRRVAPTWLIQLPALLEEEDYAVLQLKVAGATRERMLREMVEALEVLSAERLFLLVLEDAHWSDVSTIDLLNLLARRRERARILVLVTSRQAELVVSDHPLKTLKQELVTRGDASEVMLGGLPATAVQQYVRQRFAVPDVEAEFATLVYRRTEGHPLFMVQLADYLVQGEKLAALTPGATLEAGTEVPQQLRQLIEGQVVRLTTDEQRLLEAGSVAGVEFTLASIAAAIEKPTNEIETQCEQLSQRGQFIVERDVSHWPDGTVSGRYGFRHALYQEVLYQRLSASRRVRLHRRVGEREEAGYGARVHERAAELAMHFEEGRDSKRAVQYLQQAGENAVRRSAYQEAITHLSRSLELLRLLPDTPERTQQELAVQMTFGPALKATKGFAAPEVGDTYARARELCQQTGNTRQLAQALFGLWDFYEVQGNIPRAREFGDQLLALAQANPDADLLIEAHWALGDTCFWAGDCVGARAHLEEGIAFYNLTRHRSHVVLYGQDPGMSCLAYSARPLWSLGYAHQALQRGQEALALAHELAHPFSQAMALNLVTFVAQMRRDAPATQAQAEALLALAHAHGFALSVSVGLIWRGWALAAQGQEQEGLAQLRQGLAARQGTGARLAHTYFLALLAEVYEKMERVEESLAILAEALVAVEHDGIWFYAAELYRLKGELTLQSKQVADKSMPSHKRVKNKLAVSSPQHLTPGTHAEAEAEACFLKAIEIARQQHAKSFELRAMMSLVRLRQQQASEQEVESAAQGEQSKRHATCSALAEAYTMLSEVYAWFTEGFDTKDLQEAKALLEELGAMVNWEQGETGKR